MKKGLLTFGLLMTTSLSAFADNLSAIDVLKTNANWDLVLPGTMCVEHYRFSPEGRISIASNQERVTGSYSFITGTNTFSLPAIVISFETDNQQADCMGNSANQAGTASTNFLKIESAQKIYFCLDAMGKNCPVYLKPVR